MSVGPTDLVHEMPTWDEKSRWFPHVPLRPVGKGRIRPRIVEQPQPHEQHSPHYNRALLKESLYFNDIWVSHPKTRVIHRLHRPVYNTRRSVDTVRFCHQIEGSSTACVERCGQITSMQFVSVTRVGHERADGAHHRFNSCLLQQCPALSPGYLAKTGRGDDPAENERQPKQGEAVVGVGKDLGVVEEDDQHANGKKAKEHPRHPCWAGLSADLGNGFDRSVVVWLCALGRNTPALHTALLRTRHSPSLPPRLATYRHRVASVKHPWQPSW